MGIAVPVLLSLTLAADAHQALAAEVEEELARGEDGLSRRLDLDALTARSLRGLELPKGFAEGIREGMAQGVPVGKEIIRELGAGGSLRLLRVRPVDGEPRALFRLIPHDGGVNYLDLVLTPAGQAPARIVDIHVAEAGELLSETMRRMALLALPDVKQGLLDRLLRKEQTFLKHVALMRALMTAYKAGDWKQVLALHQKLPEPLRSEKTFLRYQVHAANGLGDDEKYLQSLQQLIERYPGDPAAEMAAIDGYLLRKRYALSLKAIDRLDAKVGGDPYLHVLRSGVYLSWKKRQEARDVLARAVQEEPALQAPYWTLIALAMEDQQWDETARLLTAVERDAGVELVDLTELEDFAAFVKTPQYRKWLKRRKAR